MVNDQEPRYQLIDPDTGAVVGSFFQNDDGNVEIQDETGTGSVFGPNGIVTPAIDAESVSTGRLDIGNVRYRDEVGESIDIDPDSGQVSVFVDGISSSALVYVDFFVGANDSSADAFLRFNDDSDTNYDYDLSDGTTPTGQSEIVLGDFSDSFSQVGGELLIQQREIGVRACGPVNAGGRIGRTNAVCERFTFEGAENVSKIELFAGEDGDQISDIGLKVTEVII